MEERNRIGSKGRLGRPRGTGIFRLTNLTERSIPKKISGNEREKQGQSRWPVVNTEPA